MNRRQIGGIQSSKHQQELGTWRHGEANFGKSQRTLVPNFKRFTGRDARKLCKEGQLDAAIHAVINLMDSRASRASTDILYCLLQGCIDRKSLVSGRQVHQLIVRSGYIFNTFLGSHLIRMFAECGSLLEASQVFDDLPDATVYTWSAIILAYAKHGQGEQAIKLFSQMQHQSSIEPNVYTFVGVLKACAGIASLSQGRLVHSLAIECCLESDVYVCNTLVDMYAKCGNLDNARVIFNRLAQRSMVTWNAMITGYVQHEHGEEALYLFKQMQYESLMPDKVTCVGVLKACTSRGTPSQGRLVHVFVIEMGYDGDDFVGSTLIDMYTKCGDLADARNVFDKLSPGQSVVTWNVMITGYVQQGRAEEGLQVFGHMQQVSTLPDKVTFMSILKACASLTAVDEGRLIHAHLVDSNLESDILMGNNLLDMYAKCGRVQDAFRLFKMLPKRDVVTWTAMIGAHVHCGNGKEAVQLFQQMQQEGVDPNEVTFASLLKACSIIAAVEQGKLIHGQILLSGMESDILMGSTLIDMYAKCGSVDDASRVFDKLSERSVVTWSAMIGGYAMHGQYELALKCFEDMQLEGLEPDGITMLCLLSACSQMGLVDEGYHQYRSIFEGHSSAPLMDHYTCMIDLLVHAGCPHEAKSLYETMPWQSDIVGWMSFLSTCRKYGNVELGQGCFDRVMTQDGGCTAAYVLMSNLYIDAGMHLYVHNMHELRRSANIWKKAGKACIELKNQVHNFTVGEIGSSQSNGIQAKLSRMGMNMKGGGYVPHLNLVSQP